MPAVCTFILVTHLFFLSDGEAPKGFQVEGEMFEIRDSQGLYLIDTLEGNGHFYLRQLDKFIDLGPGKEHVA